MFFDKWPDIWRILIIAATSYAAIIIILRLGGKRTLSKLNAFDFIVTIALGSVLASTVLLKDTSLSEGLAAIAALVVLQLIVTWSSNRSDWFAKILRSEPRIVLRDGKFLEDAMAQEHIRWDEIEAAIRRKGHGKVEDVTAVVLEADGTLSVICEGKAEDCTALRSVLGPKETSL
ncbi:DUF421 domain-containing protein [Altererythrobacter indicus]|uniref:DUF421 domain-containing protein n=1 Tax=Altericroceibacterium indicum TaxID=374177 RepID=A0A845A5A4_9SPHN|nr:YetF domain-containing protein [Altericroceibacterium indicum]MXP25492.1 DUF421 domain-containing protein [Altericroceibacterium indicum]